jgi:uncharacterized membrane protein
MTGLAVIIQLFIFFFLPAYLIRLSHRFKLDKVLSDIVICYGIGILLGNTKALWLFSWANSPETKATVDSIANATAETAEIAAFASVLLAMPMLLMLNNVTDWLKYTGKIIGVFFAGVLAAALGALAVAYFYRSADLEAMPTAAGMLTGVYTGGTPNMVAISKALNADDQLFIVLNATDTLCSGLYFFFLLGVGKAFFGLFLPKFKGIRTQADATDSNEQTDYTFFDLKWTWACIQPILIATLLAIGAVLLSAAPALLIPDVKGEINQTILLLTLTTVGIALSFSPAVRNLKGVYAYAQYLLLIFGLGAGYMADFGQLISQGGSYLLFNALTFLTILVLHFLYALISRTDRESFMISSTATILGPPFVAQVSSAIKNKALLPVGIALSLLGLGIANYSGVLVHYIVSLF